MSNRIIKDFKGWSLLNEDKGTNPHQFGTPEYLEYENKAAIDAYNASLATANTAVPKPGSIDPTSPLFNKTPNLFGVVPGVNPPAANTPIGQGPHPDPLVNRVIDAGTAAQAAAATQAAAAAQAAAAKAKAATPVAATPIVPTPDAELTADKATALTRNDWAAIQTKLNAAELALQQATLVNQSNPANFSFDTKPNPKPNPNPPIKEARSMSRLYEEQLVPDGIAGPKTLSAVNTFVTNYNLNPANTTKLPADPIKDKATATTINPQVLAAIAAASTAPTTQLPTGPTGPAAAANSVFGPSANITEADFAVESSIDTRKYTQTNYSLATTKLLLAAAKMFYDATSGPGTNPDEVDTSILMCKSASDFYKLNAVIKNVTGTDIQFIINDEYEGDNIDEVISLNTKLTALNVQSSYETNGAPGDSTRFKMKSFIITIPGGSDPAVVFPPAVYKMAGEQSMVVNNQPKPNLLYAKP